jgi:GNAT superfamily N-acetyltransferase
VTLPDPLARFWEAMSEVGQLCRRTPWGFVVADPRYPKIWDANHAAVFEANGPLSLTAIRAELGPVLRWAMAPSEHVELWELDDDAPLRAELAAWNQTTSGDVDMVFEGPMDALPDEATEGFAVGETAHPTAEFLRWYRASRNQFGDPLAGDVLDQMLARDLEVFLPLGMRWFVAWRDGQPIGYSSLLSLAGVGYLDGVMTMPQFRRRGVATATIAAAIRASAATGDEAVHLLADGEGRPRRLYERLGFRVRGHVESCTRPLDPEPD